jgi:hypothetical protein
VDVASHAVVQELVDPLALDPADRGGFQTEHGVPTMWSSLDETGVLQDARCLLTACRDTLNLSLSSFSRWPSQAWR